MLIAFKEMIGGVFLQRVHDALFENRGIRSGRGRLWDSRVHEMSQDISNLVFFAFGVEVVGETLEQISDIEEKVDPQPEIVDILVRKIFMIKSGHPGQLLEVPELSAGSCLEVDHGLAIDQSLPREGMEKLLGLDVVDLLCLEIA